MTGEEKILSLLEAVAERLDTLENEVRKTNIILENEIRPAIGLLSDGHRGVVGRLDTLDTLAEDVEYVKMSVSVLKLLQIKKD